MGKILQVELGIALFTNDSRHGINVIRLNRVNLYQDGTNLSDYTYARIAQGGSNMPVMMNGQKYYRTSEACHMVGISKTTLLRWLRQGNLKLPEYRDRRKWRLFTREDVNALNQEANRVTTNK